MKLLQIWQFGGNSADAPSLDAAIESAVRHGFDGLLVKALDGIDWMRRYDPSPNALGSADEVARQRDRCHAARLKYYVWSNPLHDVDLDVQAALTADATLASDGLFIDAEPYDGFWGSFRPQGSAERFMQRIRERAPRAWIALQPDPRPARLAELRPEEWLPYVDAFAGQHYWTDFAPNPAAWRARALLELANAAELGQQWGKPVLPTLPGITDAASVPTALLRDFAGFVVYRLGTTSRETLNLLGSVSYDHVDGSKPATDPPTAVDPFAGLVNALAYVCDTLGDQLQGQADRLGPSGQGVLSLVGEMRRVRTQFVGERPQPGDVVNTGDSGREQPTPTPTEPAGDGETGRPHETPPSVRFNWQTPTLTQPNDWACSVFSATMALNSLGVNVDWLAVRQDLGDSVSEQHGLMDARGPALVGLFKEHGFNASAIPWTERDGAGATWEEVTGRAGRMPVLLGGRRWYHWTFVRNVDANGNLALGNPAPSWKFVGQTMEREEFDRLGPWTMVWVNLDQADGQVEEEDPVRIAELEEQVSQLQQQVAEIQDRLEGLVQGLAHVADVIVPELAGDRITASRKAELVGTAKSIREQFVGPAPSPTR